ncbi:hypothetical protein V8C40DRAFT_283134 [Trichoderma camerunense]
MVEKYEDVLNQSLEGIQDAPRIATPEGAVREISRQWDVRFEQMGYLLDQWLEQARCVNIDEGQAVLRHYLENSWELLQYPVPWTCLCWAVESLVIHPLSDPKFRKLLVTTITKMGYYIRLSRIVPSGPPAHREHLRQLLRMLYKTVLQFSMLLVAYPNSDYLLEPRNAETIRTEFSNRERDLVIFESSWLYPRLESALGAVPEPNDHGSDTSYDYMMSSEPEPNDHGSDTSDSSMMSSEPDSETLGHPSSSDYAPTPSRSQSTSPGLRYCIHRSAIESRRVGTVSV